MEKLGDAGDPRANSLLKRAFEIDPDSVIRTLIRLTQDFHDEDARPQPLIWLSHVVDPNAEEPHIATLREVDSLLPQRTQALRQYAHDVTARLVESLPPLKERVKVIEESEMGLASESSRLLNNLSNHLSWLGRREDALKAIEEAVDLYRNLAAQRPDAFNADLTSSLNNLSTCLSVLGRREDALKASEEAVEIRRKLAAQRPDAFNPALATSIGVKSQVLSGIERERDALDAIREGVEILRPSFLALPAAFEGLMDTLVGIYFQLAESLSENPDAGLLGPIEEAFERLKKRKEE